MKATYKSDRLTFAIANDSDLEEMQLVFNSCAYIEKWAGGEVVNAHRLFRGEIKPEDLPIQNLKIFKITEDDSVIGCLVIFFEYPLSDVLYLGGLYILQERQSSGYGKETVKTLFANFQGYRFRLIASLKNWKALKFWIDLGFNKVTGYFGDLEHSESTFAEIELEYINNV
jgi:hypothetical protein